MAGKPNADFKKAIKIAKEIRAKSPSKKWTSCVSDAWKVIKKEK